MLRMLWRAAFSADSWFRHLDNAPMDLRRAAVAVFLSWAVAASMLAVTFVQVSQAQAYASVLVLTFLGGLLQGALLWGASGLITHLLGDVDVRAFEMTGWSWSPVFFTSLVLLPAAFIAPAFALIIGVPTALVWHLTVLRKGLEWFGTQRPLLVLLTYVMFVYLLPLGILGYLFSTFTPPA